MRPKHPSTRLVRSCVCAALLAFLLLPGCGQAPAPTTELSVYFTADTHGRLEPCGCFTGQFGGLTRLKTVFDAETSPFSLRLDVGDAVAGHADYDLIQYRYLLRAYESMRYDAVNLGAREACFSAAQLRQLQSSSPVPILSANVLDAATGKTLFPPFRIVTRNGWKIGIIGVVDPRGVPEPGAGLTIASMETTLAKLIPTVQPQTDLLILLAFTDEETLDRLANQFYETQIILGGRVRQPAQELKRSNRSLVYFVTNESRALGILRLKLSRGTAPVSAHNEIRLLHDKIPQDESIRDLARAYRKEVRTTRLRVDDPESASDDRIPGVRAVAQYVGTARCAECHKTTGAAWAKSGHAKAFATLLAREADADPNCVGCHTIGFGTPSGYQRKWAGAQLVDVGCESCHGPGSLHVRQREGDKSIDFRFRELGAGDCKKCHYGEFSRPFYWNEFWPPIQHGKEKLP